MAKQPHGWARLLTQAQRAAPLQPAHPPACPPEVRGVAEERLVAKQAAQAAQEAERAQQQRAVVCLEGVVSREEAQGAALVLCGGGGKQCSGGHGRRRRYGHGKGVWQQLAAADGTRQELNSACAAARPPAPPISGRKPPSTTAGRASCRRASAARPSGGRVSAWAKTRTSPAGASRAGGKGALATKQPHAAAPGSAHTHAPGARSRAAVHGLASSPYLWQLQRPHSSAARGPAQPAPPARRSGAPPPRCGRCCRRPQQ